MSENKQYKIEETSEDAHIIHLKHQVDVVFDEKYDYYLKSPVKKFFSKIFMFFAIHIFKVINFFFYGLKIVGKKTLKDLRKQKTPFVIVANHCLVLDSDFAVVTTFPRTTYVPTVEPTMKIPFVRHILRAGNIVPIPFNLKGLVKFKKDCNEMLQNGKSVLFFPEGALWPWYGKLRNFKPGAFRFAVDGNAPVLPYCIYFRKRTGLWKLLGRKPLATMEILPPIYHNKDLPKKDAIYDLMERTHAAMKQVIDKHPYDNPKYAEIEKELYGDKTETATDEASQKENAENNNSASTDSTTTENEKQ